MEIENLLWRKESMLDNKLLGLIDDTGEALELSSSVIEKDYFVTQVIHALSGIENEYFRLVFAGGTCLAVSLTRRIAAIERGYHDDDQTLVRHVYDLNAIRQADRINDVFFSLAKTIIGYDARQSFMLSST